PGAVRVHEVPGLLVEFGGRSAHTQKDRALRKQTFASQPLTRTGAVGPGVRGARLKLMEYQAEAGDHKRAFDGLAVTVKKFPDEGRYLPKMVTKMQEVAKDVKGSDALMARFWLEILPRVPARRGGAVSEYCVN